MHQHGLALAHVVHDPLGLLESGGVENHHFGKPIAKWALHAWCKPDDALPSTYGASQPSARLGANVSGGI